MKTCYKVRCNETAYLTKERLTFVAKTIGTVVLTLDLWANGEMSDLIFAHMQHQLNYSTTTPSVLKPSGKV